MVVIAHNRIVAIELKRQQGGKVTPAQQLWIDALNDVGVPARICKGAAAAIEFVENVTKPKAWRDVQRIFPDEFDYTADEDVLPHNHKEPPNV